MLLVFPLDITAGKYTTAGNIGLLSQSRSFSPFLCLACWGWNRLQNGDRWGRFSFCLDAFLCSCKTFQEHFLWRSFRDSRHGGCSCGNYFQKKVVLFLPPVTWMMYRNFFAALLLFPLSFLFEQPNIALAFSAQGVFLFLSGVFAFGLSKWFFFEGIQQIGVAKSMAINASSSCHNASSWVVCSWRISHVVSVFGASFYYLRIVVGTSPKSYEFFSGESRSRRWNRNFLGFPRSISTQRQTARGVFAVRIQFSNGNIFSGVLHVGSRPTFKKRNSGGSASFQFSEYIPEGEMLSGEVLSRIKRCSEISEYGRSSTANTTRYSYCKNLLNDLK